MKMRKLALILMVVCAFALTACGSSSSSDDAEEETSEEAEEEEEASGIYTAGTYSAEGEGMGAVEGNGNVVVTITVDEDSITAVEVDASSETESIGQAAAETLAEQVLEAQGADIDGVSGATVTTDAVIEAVTAALEEAAN